MKDPDKINLWVLVPVSMMLWFAYLVVVSFMGRF